MENIVRVDIPHTIRENVVVGTGLSSWVLRVDAVAKCDTSTAARDREVAVYERLSRHSAVLPYYGQFNGSILLQFAPHGTVRQYLDSEPSTSLSTRLRWAEQVTEAISFLHSKGIFHCDISYNNIFLDADCNAMIGDFSGSSIDNEEPLGWYGTSHSHPDTDDPSEKAEIFALGSTFYEILTGTNPFRGRNMVEAEKAIRTGDFPSLDHLPALQAVIPQCWRGGYETVDNLLVDVKQAGMDNGIAADKKHATGKGPAYAQNWPLIGLACCMFTILVVPVAFLARPSGLLSRR